MELFVTTVLIILYFAVRCIASTVSFHEFIAFCVSLLLFPSRSRWSQIIPGRSNLIQVFPVRSSFEYVRQAKQLNKKLLLQTQRDSMLSLKICRMKTTTKLSTRIQVVIPTTEQMISNQLSEENRILYYSKMAQIILQIMETK